MRLPGKDARVSSLLVYGIEVVLRGGELCCPGDPGELLCLAELGRVDDLEILQRLLSVDCFQIN